MSSLCLQIVTNIYEPQGISYVDAHATFLTNDLLPLVEKTVTDKKVPVSTGLVIYCHFVLLLGAKYNLVHMLRHTSVSHQLWNSRGSVQTALEQLLMGILSLSMM